MFKLRDYQQQAVDSSLQFFSNRKEKKNGIIVIPTGGGKSLVIANIVRELDGKTIVFQPSKELLEQNFSKYISYGGYASVFSASKGQKQVSEVTFATIGSVITKLPLFKDFKYCIVDECHLVSPNDASMYSRFFSEIDCKTVGLTATPIRLKTYNFPERHSKLVMLDRMRPRFFDKYLHVTQISELVDRGFFAKTKYISFDFDKSKLRINTTGAEYTEESIKEAFVRQNVLQKIVGCIKSAFDKGKKHVLIFTPSVSDAEELSNMVQGIAFVSGQTHKSDRERILNDFKKGRIRCVANVGVLTTGFDFPELDCIILARPTMSLALYYQMIGRGVRPHQTKDECLVVDLVGNFGRFGRVEDLAIHDNKGMGIYAGKRLLTGVEMASEGGNFTDDADHDQTPVMPFGKYKGMDLSEVLVKDKAYFKWLYENVEKKKHNKFIFDFIEAEVING